MPAAMLYWRHPLSAPTVGIVGRCAEAGPEPPITSASVTETALAPGAAAGGDGSGSSGGSAIASHATSFSSKHCAAHATGASVKQLVSLVHAHAISCRTSVGAHLVALWELKAFSRVGQHCGREVEHAEVFDPRPVAAGVFEVYTRLCQMIAAVAKAGARDLLPHEDAGLRRHDHLAARAGV
eukprot:3959136-Prymnesium_polylepis.1